jgi:hypothetical protein
VILNFNTNSYENIFRPSCNDNTFDGNSNNNVITNTSTYKHLVVIGKHTFNVSISISANIKYAKRINIIIIKEYLLIEVLL